MSMGISQHYAYCRIKQDMSSPTEESDREVLEAEI